jgi:glycine oxidase
MASSRVLIVGAGAVGLFCGRALARRGARVCVLTAGFSSREDPHAASWAAAGMLGAFSEIVADPSLAHPLAGDLGIAALAAWDRYVAAFDHEPPLRRTGAWICGETPARAGRLARVVAQAHAASRTLDLFEGEALRRAAPDLAQNVEAALWAPDEGVIDIPAAFGALHAEIGAAGGEVREGVTVESVESGGARLSGGEYMVGDVVVLAPGLAAAGALAAAAPALSRLGPAKGQMLAVGMRLSATIRGDGIYAAPRGDDAVIGATMETGRADHAVDPAVTAHLHARAASLVPALAGAPVRRVWAGVRPMSPDWAPLIGWENGLLLAAGHSRNGWLLAPLTGEIIAAYVFGEPIAPLWAAFRPDRFGSPP